MLLDDFLLDPPNPRLLKREFIELIRTREASSGREEEDGGGGGEGVECVEVAAVSQMRWR